MKVMAKNRHPGDQNCIITMANGTDKRAVVGTKGTVLASVYSVSVCVCGDANDLQNSTSGA